MYLYRVLTLLAIVFMVGCASNPMKVADEQSLKKASSKESQIVFMRSSFIGSAINATVYDVTNNQTKFLGVLANGTKIAYSTHPGKHTFMVVSEAADFLEAEMSAGKTYYSIVTPRMGAWKARFSMWPIRNDTSSEYNTNSSEFQSWLSNTKLVTNTEASENWFKKNAASVKEKQSEYYKVWQQKSAADLAERTLNRDDGL